jgi:hypothetical protein
MILHAVPSFINARDYGGGNWKALEANRLALHSTGLPSSEAGFDWKNPASLIPQVTSDIRHLLIEYSWWPDILSQLKRRHRHIQVHVRTHNAEAYHHFHRSRKGLRSYADLRMWRRILHLALRDARCRKEADTLLGISEWDDTHYWQWLPGKALIRYLPYYSPWPYLRAGVEPQPWNLREPAIVSMGGNFDPSGMANVRNFDMLAMKLSVIKHERWSFLLTWWSQWNKEVPKVSERVEVLRYCEEPWDLLCGVRGLAVLTPLGFGLKTTVIDGLAAGCHVIVHPTLANRLPLNVRQLCLICDPSREEDTLRLADSLSSPPGSHSLNQQLREMAVNVFRSTISVQST